MDENGILELLLQNSLPMECLVRGEVMTLAVQVRITYQTSCGEMVYP